MITDIVIAILSSIFTTITIWVIAEKDVQFSVQSTYMIILTTCWTIFFISLVRKHTYYLIGSMIGIAISYYAIRTQLFMNKEEFYKELINAYSMSIVMGKKVIENPDVKKKDKRQIQETIYREKENLNKLKRFLKWNDLHDIKR